MASTNFKIDDREVDKMLNSLAAEIKKVRGVRVGWIREKHDKLGEGENTMEQIVFNNEFGSLTQPPRPFIRLMKNLVISNMEKRAAPIKYNLIY